LFPERQVLAKCSVPSSAFLFDSAIVTFTLSVTTMAPSLALTRERGRTTTKPVAVGAVGRQSWD